MAEAHQRTEARKARASNDLLLHILRSAVPAKGGERETRIADVLSSDAVRRALDRLAPDSLDVALYVACGAAEAMAGNGMQREAADLLSHYREKGLEVGIAPLEIARIENKLAGLLIQLEEPDRARTLLEHSRAILENTATDHADVMAEALILLGEADAGQKPAEAEAQFHRALSLLSGLGNDHPELRGAAHAGLSVIAYGRADWVEAETRCRQALDILRVGLGPFDRDTLQVLNNLAAILDASGQPDRAQELFQQAARDARRELFADDPARAAILNTVGEFVMRQSPGLAESLLREAWTSAPSSDPLRWNVANNLGRCLGYQGKWCEAVPLLRNAYDLRRRMEGPDAFWTRSGLTVLGQAMLECEGPRSTEVESLARELLGSCRRVEALGERIADDDLINAVELLAAILRGQECYTSELVALSFEDVMLRQRANGGTSQWTLKAINRCAGDLLTRGEHEMAFPMLLDAWGTLLV